MCHSQIEILEHIQSNHMNTPVSCKMLAEELSKPTTSVSKQVTRLVSLGKLERLPLHHTRHCMYMLTSVSPVVFEQQTKKVLHEIRKRTEATKEKRRINAMIQYRKTKKDKDSDNRKVFK